MRGSRFAAGLALTVAATSGCKEVFSFPTFTTVDGGRQDATRKLDSSADGASEVCSALAAGATACGTCIAATCCSEYATCEGNSACATLARCALNGTCSLNSANAAPGLASLAACTQRCGACSTCTMNDATVPCPDGGGTHRVSAGHEADSGAQVCMALASGPTMCGKCIASTCCSEYATCEDNSSCATLAACVLNGTCSVNSADAAPGLASLGACVQKGCGACATCTMNDATVQCADASGTATAGGGQEVDSGADGRAPDAGR